MGETVRAIEAAGADGLSLINTLRGTTLDARLQPTLSRGTGGYSGPALRPSHSPRCSPRAARRNCRSSAWEE